MQNLLEFSMFINASLPKVYYLMKWIGDSDTKKNKIKKHFARYHLHRFSFFHKKRYQSLKLMTCSYFCKE